MSASRSAASGLSGARALGDSAHPSRRDGSGCASTEAAAEVGESRPAPESAFAAPEERIVNAARWYVECQEWGLRTDCSGFELREAVGALFPDVLNDTDALADASYDRETISGG